MFFCRFHKIFSSLEAFCLEAWSQSGQYRGRWRVRTLREGHREEHGGCT